GVELTGAGVDGRVVHLGAVEEGAVGFPAVAVPVRGEQEQALPGADGNDDGVGHDVPPVLARLDVRPAGQSKRVRSSRGQRVLLASVKGTLISWQAQASGRTAKRPCSWLATSSASSSLRCSACAATRTASRWRPSSGPPRRS